MKKIWLTLIALLLAVMLPFGCLSEVKSNASSVPLSFTTTTLSGQQISSSIMKNYDLVMLNFWAEWCGPCVGELPDLQRIHQQYGNVLLLGVWVGNSVDSAIATANEAGVTYPLINCDYSFYQYLDIDGSGFSIPQTCFFDKNGSQLGDAYVGSGSYDYWSSIVTSLLGTVPPDDPDVPVSSIRLNKAKVTLTRTSSKKNPTAKLKATVSPDDAADKAVVWSSSNPKVAKVSASGKVTGLKKGSAVITCTAKDGSGVKATCKVTVKDKLVTGITLNKAKISLKKGKTYRLKVKSVTPSTALNKSVKWTSSDKNIATVSSSGKVKAKAKGTCYITCTAADGSGISVICKVTVK